MFLLHNEMISAELMHLFCPFEAGEYWVLNKDRCSGKQRGEIEKMQVSEQIKQRNMIAVSQCFLQQKEKHKAALLLQYHHNTHQHKHTPYKKQDKIQGFSQHEHWPILYIYMSHSFYIYIHTLYIFNNKYSFL